jgi:CRISPR-associated protein Cas1
MGAVPVKPSSAQINPEQSGPELPDYLPARMLNEYAYCPRLFYYEWVEGLFQESKDTIEGAVQHTRVDAKATELPGPEGLTDTIHARSVTLSSERLNLIAKMDLVESDGGAVTPVDYKHGRPREGPGGLELWPSDRAQMAVQGMVLRDNGYRCEEGIVYYRKTGQRVRVAFDEALMVEVEALVQQARRTAESNAIPPPLVDSPKCPGCSMVGICLPDETIALTGPAREPLLQIGLFDEPAASRKPPVREVRPMVTARAELRPLYLNAQGTRVGKSGAVLQVKDRDSILQEVRIGEICQVSLMGNVQLSTQAVQTLCEADVPICYFSMGGWFYGMTRGFNTKNVFLRRSQFRLVEQLYFARTIARRLTAGKIRNQRTLLQRNHVEPRKTTLDGLRGMAERAETASDLEELLGLEGKRRGCILAISGA